MPDTKGDSSNSLVFNRAGLLSIVGIVVVYFAVQGWMTVEAGAKQGALVPGLIYRLNKLESKVDLLVEVAIRQGYVTRAEAKRVDKKAEDYTQEEESDATTSGGN